MGNEVVYLSPTVGPGSGTIGGAIAAGEVAYGSGTNEITGDAGLTVPSAGRLKLLRSGSGNPQLQVQNGDYSIDGDDALLLYQTDSGLIECDAGYTTGPAGFYWTGDPTDGTFETGQVRTPGIIGNTAAGYHKGGTTDSALLELYASSARTSCIQLANTVPAGSTERAQLAVNLLSQVDATTHAYDTSVFFGARNGAGDTLPAYSIGSEGTFLEDGTFATYRLFIFDQVNEASILFIDHQNPTTLILEVDLNVVDGTVAAASFIATDGAQLMQSTEAFTDAAGADTGTLTNAPAAGNPTKWIQINDNGTIRAFPTWLVS